MQHKPMYRLSLLIGLGLPGCAGDVGPSGLTTASMVREDPVAVRGTQVLPGKRSRVFTLAGLGAGCAATALPKMTIDAQPAKGAVTFEAVEPATIQYSLSGNCIGQRVAGTGVYYTSHAGATGPDVFTISAHAGHGTVATRTIAIRIAE